MIVSVCKEGNILILPLENDQHLKILLDAHTDVSCDTRTGLIFSDSSEEASTSQPMCSSSFTIPDESKLQIVHLHDLRVSVENFEVRINC